MGYMFKTDREKQWEIWVSDTSISRRNVKILHEYFLTGNMPSENDFGLGQVLFLQPEQNLLGWQKAISDIYNLQLDNYKVYMDQSNEEAQSRFYLQLQRNFLGFITNYQFHPEDQAWIFTQIFGETYNPDRKFPLLLPGEDEYRVISLTPLEIIRSFSVCFRSLFRVGNKSSFAFAMYLVGYFGSLVPYIPIDVYQVASPKNKNLKVIWDSLKYIFHYAHQDTSSASEDDVQKIQLARTLKSCFDNYQGDKGDYEQLVALVEKEGLQIPVYE
tara:strand:- start:107 stop:922 length:816 start_codon:yes stop_codon:yes gene_type:complete